ncbi:hypothetical protein BC940DRAFT_312224 [Gongronella butleri]|nr:hypothetical protein BC940DRAFT_312224 [Gongronella butleri]
MLLCSRVIKSATRVTVLARPLSSYASRGSVASNNKSTGNRTRSPRPGNHSFEKSNKIKETWTKKQFVKMDGVEDKEGRHLFLIPADAYAAAERVPKILHSHDLPAAVDFVSTLPASLQSTVAWNHLLSHCAIHGRANRAEKLFHMMRKRGLVPNERTFTHMLSALANSTSESTPDKANAWIERMAQHDMVPSVIHTNAQLQVYARAGLANQVMAKVRQRMRDQAPSPDHVTLSIALEVVPLIVNQPTKEIRRMWHYAVDHQQPVAPARTSSRLQAKADGIMRLDTMQNDAREAAVNHGALKIDDTLLVAFFKALARLPRHQPQARNTKYRHDALDLVQEITSTMYNVPSTDEAPADAKRVRAQPGIKVLDALVRCCGSLRAFDLGKSYYDQLCANYPNLKPDKQAKDAYAWMTANTSNRRRDQGTPPL